MRNAVILVLLVFATVVVWGATSAFLVSPQLHVGQSYHAYLHLVTVPELTELLVYAAWAFTAAWLSFRFLSRVPRRFAVTFILLFYLFVRGVFFPINFDFRYLVQQFVLAGFVVIVMFLGARVARRFTATSNQTMQPTPNAFASGLAGRRA